MADDIAHAMMRRLAQAAAALALLSGPALAQLPMPTVHLHEDKPALTPEEKAKQEATDEAYKRALAKVPEQQSHDPWGNIRPNPSAATTTASEPKKPAPKKKTLAQQKPAAQ